MEQPIITYPCTWSYRLICEDCELVMKAVPGKMGSIKHEVKPANRSKRGKYISINVEAIVNSEEERNSIVPLLMNIPTVRMVL